MTRAATLGSVGAGAPVGPRLTAPSCANGRGDVGAASAETLAGNALSGGGTCDAGAGPDRGRAPLDDDDVRALCPGVREVFARHGALAHRPLGARAEFGFTRRARPAPAPRRMTQLTRLLDDLVHAALLNRGVLLTPFHKHGR